MIVDRVSGTLVNYRTSNEYIFDRDTPTSLFWWRNYRKESPALGQHPILANLLSINVLALNTRADNSSTRGLPRMRQMGVDLATRDRAMIFKLCSIHTPFSMDHVRGKTTVKKIIRLQPGAGQAQVLT